MGYHSADYRYFNFMNLRLHRVGQLVDMLAMFFGTFKTCIYHSVSNAYNSKNFHA